MASTITRVLLHNYKNVIEKNFAIGSSIQVCLAGQIIPFAVANNNDGSCFDIGLPWKSKNDCDCGDSNDLVLRDNDGVTECAVCPSCGSLLHYQNGGVDIYCHNENCPGFVKKRIYNASAKCFEIIGLAESTIAKVCEKFGVTRFYQLLDLEAERLASLPGFATDSGEKLWMAIQNARTATDVQVLASLGIPLIGRHVAKDALTTMTLASLRTAPVESLSEIKGFGPEKVKSLFEGLQKYSGELDELIARINVKQTFAEPGKSSETATTGQTICFTGEAPFPRAQCQEIARKNGYEPVSGVSKQLSVLVCSAADTTSSKAQKARKYGVKILTFDDWFNSLAVKEAGAAPAHGNATVDAILSNM